MGTNPTRTDPWTALTTGVRFIEGGKSKRAMIISKIRGRNAYLSETTKFRTNR